MCPANATAVAGGDVSKSTCSSSNKENANNEAMYTLGDHARHLNLSFEIVDTPCCFQEEKKTTTKPATQQQQQQYTRYWYCDWTKHFVPSMHQNRLVRDVVKEYCQPIKQADLEDMMVGVASVSRQDPLAVRTVAIQLRPDCDHIKVFQALAAAIKMNPNRRVILSDTGNFPSDLYMAEGLISLLGPDYELRLVAPEDVEAAITDEIAVTLITEVDYRTGRKHDMTALAVC